MWGQAEERHGAFMLHQHSCLTSWLCWLWASVPKPSGGILTSVRGLFFLLLQPPPPPTAEDYTRLQLSMGGSLPGRRPAPGHPVQPGEQIGKGPGVLSAGWSSCCCVCTQPRPGKTLFWFFSPPWPLSLFVSSGGFLPDNVGLALKSQTLAAEAALEVAGLCREGLGRPARSQAVGVHLKDINLWREFGCFFSRVD